MLRTIVAAGLAAGIAATMPISARCEPVVAGAASAPTVVVIVMRHGVRSPTDPSELAPYAARPWPVWEVPPGDLTPHGAAAIRLLGATYRRFYASSGLVPPVGCLSGPYASIRPDVDERTVATASAFADGFAPGCVLPVPPHAGTDPLFHPVPSLGKADPESSRSELLAEAGGSPQSVVAAREAAFGALDRVLGCVAPASCVPLSGVPAVVVTSPKTGLSSIEGAPALASTAVEQLILAYADGKDPADVGWGRVDAQTLRRLAPLHSLKYDLAWTATPGRALGSNLAVHVLTELESAAAGERSAPLVAFVGHDSNLAALGALLRVHWQLGDGVGDDTPPGGALVFELHGTGPSAEVDAFYAAPSLEETRTLAPDAPLHRVALPMPGCGPATCTLERFAAFVRAASDPGFTTKP